MNLSYTFGARLDFSLRNGPSRTIRYGAGSIAKENFDIARKALQGDWLCRATGRAGV